MGGYEFRLPALCLVNAPCLFIHPLRLRCARGDIVLGADAHISCTLITRDHPPRIRLPARRRRPVTRAKLAYVGALLLVAAISLTTKDAIAQFPPNQSQSAAFAGAWCAQGDPTKHASISSNGAFLTLTNENGDTSPGQFQGQTGIVAPGW